MTAPHLKEPLTPQHPKVRWATSFTLRCGCATRRPAGAKGPPRPQPAPHPPLPSLSPPLPAGDPAERIAASSPLQTHPWSGMFPLASPLSPPCLPSVSPRVSLFHTPPDPSDTQPHGGPLDSCSVCQGGSVYVCCLVFRVTFLYLGSVPSTDLSPGPMLCA